MAYEVKQNDQGQDFIIVEVGEQSRGFLADETSPEFVAWCDTEDGKAYLATFKA